MRGSIVSSDDQSKYGSPQTYASQNEATFIKIEKENTAIIEMESKGGVETKDKSKLVNDCLREVYNNDLIEETRRDTGKENRRNIDDKQNAPNRIFNSGQNQFNPPTTWVQFQGEYCKTTVNIVSSILNYLRI